MAPTVRQRNPPNVKKEVKKPVGKKSPASSRGDETPSIGISPSDIGIVYPSGDTAFKALLSARFCAAIWSHISDCDETYNYWEPSHYLLFGSGLQTWEYSPDYALRSYTYLLLHVGPAWIYHNLLQPNRMLVFYFLRCLLGLVSAFCEVYFYKSVCREFGVQVGRLVLAFLIPSAGLFISATAFLPSAFSMHMAFLMLAAWYKRQYELAVFVTAVSALLSWPFAAILGLPLVVDMLYRRGDWQKFVRWSAVSLLVVLLPMIAIDSAHYGRLVAAPYNIVRYNVFTQHGPNLYGTEPITFYFANAFLNFNFVFVGALLTPLMLLLVRLSVSSKPRNPACLPYWLSLMPLYLWIAVFFFQPHKEERFLFPAYPAICLCGAVSLDALQKLYYRHLVPSSTTVSHYLNHTTWLMASALFVTTLASLARILALYNGYHAPLDVMMELGSVSANHRLPPGQEFNVCVGKEWHRLPPSFFLPSDSFKLRFIRSEFRGQLPTRFNSTSVAPPNMNDQNKEEMDRYVDIERCHFLVDSETGVETEFEPNYSADKDKWRIIKQVAFLDTARSHPLFRAFFIPFVSGRYCEYIPYNLLQSTRLKLTKLEAPKPK